MPSPFPGMDPYLEAPSLWPDVHGSLLSAMRERLAVDLRPAYFVQIEERVYVTDEFDPARKLIIPDLAISETEYDLILDYRREPPPPLTESQCRWSREILQPLRTTP